MARQPPPRLFFSLPPLLTHHPHASHTHTLTATNLLGSIKQLTFVRHGEHHPDVNGTASMCLSERGVSRGLMLARYFDRNVAPKGVLKPTMVLAMNGTTEKADPPSVRPINTAVPFVVTHGIPPSRYIRDFTQTEANRVADYVLANGTGQVVLFVWQHWDGACVREKEKEREAACQSHSHTKRGPLIQFTALDIINALGVPLVGWNNYNLSAPTDNVYPPVIVITPSKDGVRTRLYNTPNISDATLMPQWVNGAAPPTVHWESFTSWPQVAAQQGHLKPLGEEESV